MRRVILFFGIFGTFLFLLSNGCSGKDEDVKSCPECPKNFYCDLNIGKCVPKCFQCQVSEECDSNQVCINGCCKPADSSAEQIKNGEASREVGKELTEMPGEKTIAEEGPEALDGGEVTTERVPEQTGGDTGAGGDKASGDCFSKPCPSGLCCSSSGQCVTCGKKLRCEPCGDHPECGPNQRCVEAQGQKLCLPLCGTNDSCPIGFLCYSSNPKYGKICVPSSTCTPPNLCQGVSCPGGKRCCPKTGKCADCCTKSDCGAGEICDGGICKPDPNACGGPCKPDEFCNYKIGKCEKDCRKSGFKCPTPDQLCDRTTGKCVKKDCRSNWNCPTGQICDNVTGKCKSPTCVQNPALCRPPSCCNRATAQCTTDCTVCGCRPGYTCDRITKRCKLNACTPKKSCLLERDCCGRKCKFVVLLLSFRCSCSKNSECPPGQMCLRGICL